MGALGYDPPDAKRAVASFTTSTSQRRDAAIPNTRQHKFKLFINEP